MAYHSDEAQLSIGSTIYALGIGDQLIAQEVTGISINTQVSADIMGTATVLIVPVYTT